MTTLDEVTTRLRAAGLPRNHASVSQDTETVFTATAAANSRVGTVVKLESIVRKAGFGIVTSWQSNDGRVFVSFMLS